MKGGYGGVPGTGIVKRRGSMQVFHPFRVRAAKKCDEKRSKRWRWRVKTVVFFLIFIVRMLFSPIIGKEIPIKNASEEEMQCVCVCM